MTNYPTFHDVIFNQYRDKWVYGTKSAVEMEFCKIFVSDILSEIASKY